MACVFQRKIWEGLEPREIAKWREAFLADIRAGAWILFPVSNQLLYLLESLTRGLPRDAALRAGDAIHLATAAEAGFTEIWSNDRRLLAVAPYFGLEGRSV
jgi:predicted nucleic acid-binding protein